MSAVGPGRHEISAELNRLSFEVIGAAIEVHRVLGPGLLESIYEEALCIELGLRSVPFVRQPIMELAYKDHPLGQGRFDLLVGGELVVELKAVEKLIDIHTAQVLTYLRTTGRQLGLLINFSVPVLHDGIKRVVLT